MILNTCSVNKYKILLKAFIACFLIFISASCFAQTDSEIIAQDTLVQSAEVPAEGPYYTLALSTLMLAFAIVFFAAIIAISAILLLAVATLVGLIIAGLASISILHGLQKRSVSRSIKTFLWLSIPIVTGMAGMILAWFFSGMWQWHLTANQKILIGGISGWLAGGIVCFLLIKLSGALLNAILSRFNN